MAEELGSSLSAAAIEDWLVKQLALHLELPPEQLDRREPFTSYGLASRDALVLSGELEEWLERSLSPTLVYEYPTIELLARYLAEGTDTPDPSAPIGEGLPNAPIAIVGIGCRVPGADDPESFWQLLEQGRDAIREVPASRWSLADLYDSDPAVVGKMSTRWGGFLDDVESFDAGFFGISQREAVRMDPQQRLLLEVAWEALEDAGLAADTLADTPTGVFVGISSNDYGQAQFSRLDLGDPYAGTGNALSIAANRLSYVFGLHGPSVAVDTACSSSLVAVHLACRSLRDGECTLALVGGVNLILNPAVTVNFSKAGFMAPDGRCKAFDARADGYVRSEGAGLLVLKPLERAIADGDRVYAVIRGSAVNHDGRTNGLTAPSGLAQAAVLREAYARAGTSPGQVEYVECHGTGTALGDPIEVNALATVLDTERRPGSRCALGSVKTNIGHLEAAAGIAGLIKVALCLQRQKLVPTLHFETPNPHIPFDALPVYVQQSLVDWPSNGVARIAGVSSFGFGGTNAHVVVQSAPTRVASPELEVVSGGEPTALLLPISARSPAALQALAERWQTLLREAGSAAISPGELCASAAVRRSHHAQRLAVVGQSAAELGAGLARAVAEPRPTRSVGGGRPRVAFVFSGQGTQYVGMGRGLLEREPIARATLEQCDALLRPKLGWSVLDVLGSSRDADGVLDEQRLEHTAVAQPTLFALQVALAAVWRQWGIVPDAVVGHSLGEIAAAHVAGVLTLEDAAELVSARGRVLQQAHNQGRMAAVALAPTAAAELVAGSDQRLHLAAHNGPHASVLSGEPQAIAEVIEHLRGQGIAARDLGGVYAFHQPRLAPLAAELERALGGVQPRPSERRMVSTLSGEVVEGQELGAHYWAEQMQRSVRFAEATQVLLDEGYTVFVEVGAQPVLGESLRQMGAAVVVGSLRRGRDERTELLTGLGRLYTAGCSVSWTGVYPQPADPSLTLPAYPWQRKRFWLAAAPAPNTTVQATSGMPHQQIAAPHAASPILHPLLGQRVSSPLLSEALFESQVGLDALPFLRDHRICGAAVLPAAAYVELALAAAEHGLGAGAWMAEELVLAVPLVLTDGQPQQVQAALGPLTGGGSTLQIVSRPVTTGGRAEWRLHATVRVREASSTYSSDRAPDLASAQAECIAELHRDDFYRRLGLHGLEYGELFQSIRRIWRGPDSALALIEVSADLGDGFPMRTGLLDASLQVLGAARGERQSSSAVPIPIGIERYARSTSPPTSRVWTYARRRPEPESAAGLWFGDVVVFDADGQPVAEAIGLRLKDTPRAALAALTAPPIDDLLYRLEWRRQPLTVGAVGLSTGPWLVTQADGGALADALRTRGQTAVVPRDADERLQLLQTGHGGRPWRGVLHVASDQDDAVDVSAGALRTVQALARLASPPRLWLITRGGQVLSGGADAAALTQRVLDAGTISGIQHAAVWGLAATVDLELPELRTTIVDTDPRELENSSALVDELLADTPENRVVLRGDSRHVARLARGRGRSPTSAAGAKRLERPASLVLEALTWQPAERRRPGPGEVEIEVRASALNFRDVLSTLGLYPGEAGPLGSECAGVVAAVGPGVADFQVGDPVVAVAPGSFATYVVTRAALIAAKPAELTFEDAAAIPVAFLTAAYALRRIAALQAGDRVLIHSATGGVGLAAIQIARAVGAEIFATAGSLEKRALLTSLGINHVMDSRTLSFADDIRAATDGLGVDVVLNSLPGEHIAANLSITRRDGRYVEIGKIGVWSQADVAAVRPDLAYTIVDMADVFDAHSSLAGRLLRELLAECSTGNLQPVPHTDFDLDNSVAAFRLMAQARHTGKLVLRHPLVHREVDFVSPDATYLITGGLGALGRATAKWLVEHGARHLVLGGRGAPNAEQADAVAELRTLGAVVTVASVDVGEGDQVADLVNRIGESMPPLRGIVHAAGVLDDAVVLGQDASRLERVLRPKVRGAWNLHMATRDVPLDFFVCFSSIAAILGSPGQANYAAANAFLDALMRLRASLGLAGTSINWGPWTGGGMAAGQRKLPGLSTIAVEEALAVLGEALRRPASNLVAARIDWAQLLDVSKDSSTGGRPPLLDELDAVLVPPSEAPPPRRSALRQRLDEAHPTQRPAVLAAVLCEEVARSLGLESPDAVDPRAPLIDLGLDSLMAVELRNSLASATGRPLPATLLFDYPTIEAMTDYLAREVLGLQPDREPVTVAADARDRPRLDPVADLERFSEQDMLALLEQKLASLGEPHG